MLPRVLVIDDEPSLLRAVARLIGGEYDVTCESDGANALASMKAGDRFDAIVCDLRMPGFDGLDLYAAIENAWPDQARRTIFLTGGGYPHEESSLRARGREVLRKPCSAPVIRAALARVVSASPPADSAVHTRKTQQLPAVASSGTRPGGYSVVNPSKRAQDGKK